MSQQERESATLHSQGSDIFSNPSSISKRKPIAKEKQVIQDQKCSKITKQQRMRIQKQKNREAAQRSRDQHKQYVTKLEKQIQLLKEKVEDNKQLCYKCRQQLNERYSFQEECEVKQQVFDEPDIFSQLSQHKLFSQIQHDGDPIFEPNQDVSNYFIRVKEEQSDNSYLKMILFLSMIVIAAMIAIPDSQAKARSRNLIEIYKAQSTLPIVDDLTIVAHQDMKDNTNAIFNSNSNGLVVKNSWLNEKCLDSLLLERQLSLTNLRATHSYDSNSGILLCSYQQSKHVPIEKSDKTSTFLRLFLLGNQIRQMLDVNSPIKNFINKNLQLNGIYRISAQIKEVELISHHNCLL